eukprot:gene30523-35551_t
MLAPKRLSAPSTSGRAHCHSSPMSCVYHNRPSVCQRQLHRPPTVCSVGLNADQRSPSVDNVGMSAAQRAETVKGRPVSGRRSVLAVVPALLLAGLGPIAAPPARAIPLAPLGPVKRIGGDKLKLSTEEVLNTLKVDLGERMYLVTGNLTEEIFDDQCR